MLTNTFFICPKCSNVRKFRIFTSNFQVVEQSPEMGIRVEESGVMPNLRGYDNYIECQICFKKLEYDLAIDIGKKYLQTAKNFINKIGLTKFKYLLESAKKGDGVRHNCYV